MKRYRVETLVSGHDAWETAYHTDSLPVAKQYATSLRNPRQVQAARVVDQRTEQVMYYDPPSAGPLMRADP